MIKQKLEQKELLIVEEIQNLYYNCKIIQCISKIDELDHKLGPICHQILQLYKGLCLFKSQQINQAVNCIEALIKVNKQAKGETVDELDVIIRSMLQLEAQYSCLPKADELNQYLIEVTEKYKQQNEQLDTYQKGIYQLGKGLYIFIETSRRQGLDQQCLKLLEEAYYLLTDFKNECMIALGWIYYTEYEYKLSYQWFQKLYDLNPKFPSLANNFALLLESMNELDKAEKLYLEEVEMRSFNLVVLNNISQFYRQKRNDIEKEEFYSEKLIHLTPKTAKICEYYSLFLQKNGQIEKAKALLQEGIFIDPTYTGCYQELSEILVQTDLEKSIKLIEKCIEINPNDGQLYTTLGRRYEVMMDQQENAIEAYKKSIELKNYLDFKIYSNGRIAFQYLYLKNYLKCQEEIFNTCNFKYSSNQSLEEYYITFGQLTQEKFQIPYKDMIDLINKQNGIVVTRFSQFAKRVQDPNLKGIFLYKIDILRTLLFVQIYQKYIQDQLIFKNQILYWDLFID